MKNKPTVTKELILYLDELFDVQLLKRVQPEDLRFLQGQLSVVDHLRSVNERQTNF